MTDEFYSSPRTSHAEHEQIAEEVKRTRRAGLMGWAAIVVTLFVASWQYTHAQTKTHEGLAEDISAVEEKNATQSEAINGLKVETARLSSLLSDLDQSVDENTAEKAALQSTMEALLREIEQIRRDREN